MTEPGLLNRRTGKSGTEGSNPSVSANCAKILQVYQLLGGLGAIFTHDFTHVHDAVEFDRLGSLTNAIIPPRRAARLCERDVQALRDSPDQPG